MSLFNHPSKLVQKVDPSLIYCDVLGEGGNGIVYLVSALGQFYALKVSKYKDKSYPLAREFHILQKLEKVEGIPEARHFYQNAIYDKTMDSNPLDCYSMQYVQSRKVIEGVYPGLEFFRKLGDIGDQVADRGYTLPDDISSNVLVDAANNPWVVDFMFSKCLSTKKARSLNRNLIRCLENQMMCFRTNEIAGIDKFRRQLKSLVK